MLLVGKLRLPLEGQVQACSCQCVARQCRSSAEVHEECIAVPLEAVLDTGIGEPARWRRLAAVTRIE